jgi:hypothetical protein
MERKPLVEGVRPRLTALAEVIRMPTAAWFGLLAAWFYYLNNFMLPSTPVWNGTSSDTAVPLTNAVRMAQGQLIYRDFFHFLPPGPELVYVLLIRIAGMHAWIFNAIACLLGIVLSCLTVRIAITVVNHTTAVIAGLLVLVLSGSPDLYHHWLTAVAATIACALLIECRTTMRIFGAGVCCGLAVCCTPQRGVLLAAGIAIFLLIEARQNALCWRTILKKESVLLGSSFITIATVVGPFIWRVGPQLFYNSTFDFILNNYTAAESNTWEAISAGLTLNSWRLLPFTVPLLANYAIVPAMYIVFPIRWSAVRNRLPDTSSARLWPIWTVGVTQLVAILYAPDPHRLATTSIPAIILFVWVLASSRRRLWHISAVGLGCGCLLWIVAVTIYHQVRRPKYFQSRIGTVAMRSADEYEIHEWLRRNTQPGSYFFAAAWPDYYVLLRLQNPSRVPFVTPYGYTRSDQVRDVIASLEQSRTEFVVWSPELDDSDSLHPSSDPLGPLRSFLSSRYQIVKTFRDSTQIWQLKMVD